MQKEQKSISLKSPTKESIQERRITIGQSSTILIRTTAGKNSRIASSTDSHEGPHAAPAVVHREVVGEHLVVDSRDQRASFIEIDSKTTTATRNEPRNTHRSK